MCGTYAEHILLDVISFFGGRDTSQNEDHLQKSVE
jgi:hypothetical protein